MLGKQSFSKALGNLEILLYVALSYFTGEFTSVSIIIYHTDLFYISGDGAFPPSFLLWWHYFFLTGCPWRIELFHQESEKEDPKETLEEELIWGRATISSVKLQPCVFELCKFYSQCVCRGFSHRAAALQRYSTAQPLNNCSGHL